MTHRARSPVLTLAWLAVGFAWQALPAAAQSVETWVEPVFIDCSDPDTGREVHPDGLDDGSGSGDELDSDTNAGIAEDSDTPTDNIWGSIVVAEANTAGGGIVHVPRRGVYRDGDDVEIDDDKVIHGFEHSDVILAPLCGDEGTGTAFTITLGSGEVAVLENITIRDYATAIDLNTTSGGTVILRNVRIEGCAIGVDLTDTTGGTLIVRDSTLDGNTVGIDDDGGNLTLQVIGSRIRGGQRGIRGVKSLTMTDSEVSNQSVHGIVSENATSWRLTGSTITHCTNEGVAVQGSGTGTHSVALSQCLVADNGDSGIPVDGALVDFELHDSVVSGNGDDGVHLQGQAGSVFSITASALTGNADHGLLVENTSSCSASFWTGFKGILMDAHVDANGGDGIEIGGTATGCSPGTTWPGSVYCGLLGNSMSGNGAYGIDLATGLSSFDCGVGNNIISYNVSGNANGTSACTSSGSSANQTN